MKAINFTFFNIFFFYFLNSFVIASETRLLLFRNFALGGLKYGIEFGSLINTRDVCRASGTVLEEDGIFCRETTSFLQYSYRQFKDFHTLYNFPIDTPMYASNFDTLMGNWSSVMYGGPLLNARPITPTSVIAEPYIGGSAHEPFSFGHNCKDWSEYLPAIIPDNIPYRGNAYSPYLEWTKFHFERDTNELNMCHDTVGEYYCLCIQGTLSPTKNPTLPTKSPTKNPTKSPTSPTKNPTLSPTENPTSPTENPTLNPTLKPTKSPTNPTLNPTKSPTNLPTSPTNLPTTNPTHPTENPTISPSKKPSKNPTFNPSKEPSYSPSYEPSHSPTFNPTKEPTTPTTKEPTNKPTTKEPTTKEPTINPITFNPTKEPTIPTTNNPSKNPTNIPSTSPIKILKATKNPSKKPSSVPSFNDAQNSSNKSKYMFICVFIIFFNIFLVLG